MSSSTLDQRALYLLDFAKVHNSHTDAFLRASGERFNVFNILGIGHLEVRTHSPIIAELLNPRGTHGQGSVFLRLFLTQFRLDGLDPDSAKVKTEYYAGQKTETTGGRLDIVVEDRPGRRLVIENKIYAGDQENQPLRCSDRAVHLIYLTLDGREPSDAASKDIPNLKCVSYRVGIVEWLESCQKEAACCHNVRETIGQYIHLIEQLTNQTTTSRMNQQLIKLVTQDEESLRAFYTLRDAERAIQTELIRKLDISLDKMAKSFSLERLDPAIQDIGSKHSGFAFTTPWLRSQNLQIFFWFDKGGYQDFFFGFKPLVNGEPCPVAARIFIQFKERFFLAFSKEPWWPAYAYWEEYRNWGVEAFEAIRSERFAQDLEFKLGQLVAIVDAVS